MQLGQQRGDTSQLDTWFERRNERKRGAHCFDDALVGHRLGGARRSEEDASTAIFDRTREFQHQPRFSDPGFAADERTRAALAGGAAPHFQQAFHLVAAANER